MLHDIAPHVFHNEFTKKEIGENDYYICVRNRCILSRLENSKVLLPSVKQFGKEEGAIHLFNIDETGYYFCEKEFPGYEYLPGFKLRTTEDIVQRFAAVTGISLAGWYQNNQYCGRCGHKTELDDKERMIHCPECGNIIYPKISPVVIVGIIHEERMLLVKYANKGHYAHYALIAGFMEIGESVEDTIRREVKEETGLKVKNFHYAGSQPWAYSDSMILGFFCELDGDEHFHFDDHELGEGKWCLPEEVENDTGDDVSITQLMMREFKKKGRMVLQTTLAK